MTAARIADTFQRLRARGETGLITFVTAGWPDLETTERLVLGMAAAGADLIELGVPFSDPLADGPVIQQASQAALARGVNLEEILALAARLRTKTDIPLVLMSYYNPILAFGPAALAAAAARAGIDGFIVPDLPLEESGPLLALTDGCGLALIPLVAPTSTPRRVAAIARRARGFVYCVSMTGVTGAAAAYSGRLAEVCRLVRTHTDLPLAVGFGIGSPGQVREFAPLGDALVVGSALMKRIGGARAHAAVSAAQEMVLDLKRALVKI